MISLNVWKRVRDYAAQKARDLHHAEQGADVMCPCCKRWGADSSRRGWVHSTDWLEMHCGDCGAISTWHTGAPVLILKGWRPPPTEVKARDIGEIASDEGFYVVWNPEWSATPTVRYDQEYKANGAAKSLARKVGRGQVFYVLEAKAAFQDQIGMARFDLIPPETMGRAVRRRTWRRSA